MSKLKNKSAAKKRFRVTASGKILFNSAYLRHNTSKRPKDMKRSNCGSQILKNRDAKVVARHFLPMR